MSDAGSMQQAKGEPQDRGQPSASGFYHTVGIQSDGSVVAGGDNVYGQCDIDFWTTIIQISAGGGHTVGLNSNGTVVAVGDNDFGQCNVSGGTLD